MGMEEFKLTSAGIDIGTTTTQLVLSEITMKNRLPGARIPKIEITDKKIVYQSPIYMTPVIEHKEVDSEALKRIIVQEYQKAGFDLKKIDTGAVIITGETAKKENAEKIIHQLAEFAGDFVVAVAGPELESILAGKGSGAAEHSKQKKNRVINLDIGGGTTNIAVFEDGNVEDCTCVNVGGRLVEIDRYSQKVSYITKPARLFIDYYELDIKQGEKADLIELEALCEKMVALTEAVVYGGEVPPLLKEIVMASPLKKAYEYDGVMFSGGVAEYIYGNKSYREELFEYGDMGILLARAFKKSRLAEDIKLLTAAHTIRATVIGAGTQTVGISGSTAFVKPEMLPIRNIPVAKITWAEFPAAYEEIEANIKAVVRRYDLSLKHNPLAVSLPCPKELSFENIEKMAKGIYGAWNEVMDKDMPLVIIVEKDIAKVLGQTIYVVSSGRMKFICIDSVDLNDGDYIDVGKPISKDDVVPIIIKTLVF